MPASLLAALQLPPATSCPEGSRGCRRSLRATATRKGRAHERVDAKTLAVRGGAPPLAAPPDQPGGKDPVRQRHLAARLPDHRYFRRRRAAACRGFRRARRFRPAAHRRRYRCQGAHLPGGLAPRLRNRRQIRRPRAAHRHCRDGLRSGLNRWHLCRACSKAGVESTLYLTCHTRPAATSSSFTAPTCTSTTITPRGCMAATAPQGLTACWKRRAIFQPTSCCSPATLSTAIACRKTSSNRRRR